MVHKVSSITIAKFQCGEVYGFLYIEHAKSFEKEKKLKDSCELQKISNICHKWTEPGISLAKSTRSVVFCCNTLFGHKEWILQSIEGRVFGKIDCKHAKEHVQVSAL